jgi:hypothetical protein
VNRRKPSHALKPQDVRELSEAAHAADFLGQPFTALVTIHFGKLMPCPADPGAYLRRDVINRLGIWCRRRGFAWTALWVRENFVGPNHEHVHLLMHLPRSMQASFEAAVRRWWPEQVAADVRHLYDSKQAVRYLSKQLSPQARFAFRGAIRREAKCRYTGTRVAPVLGRRFGMTRNLSSLVAGSSSSP